MHTGIKVSGNNFNSKVVLSQTGVLETIFADNNFMDKKLEIASKKYPGNGKIVISNNLKVKVSIKRV